MDLSDVFTVVGLVALVKKFVDFLKYATNRNVNGVVTQVVVWVAGVAAVLLYSQSDFADRIRLGEFGLGDLNVYSLLILGLAIGSLAGVTKDVIASRDDSDTARTPPLIPNSPPPAE